jgi:hypothetical protein
MWDGSRSVLINSAYFRNFFELIGGEGVRQIMVQSGPLLSLYSPINARKLGTSVFSRPIKSAKVQALRWGRKWGRTWDAKSTN